MKVIDQFKNKKVLVLGLAKSGESAARLLDKLGAIVTVNDGKPFEENPAARAAGFSSKGLPSFTVTIAPSLSNKRAADSPDLAKPKTRTFLFLN